MPDDIGPQPTPKTEPGEPNPGGADAIDDTGSVPLPADLDPDSNPQVDEVVPDEVTSPDDKPQEPRDDSDDSDGSDGSKGSKGEASDEMAETDAGADQRRDAGQEDQSGDPEPPA